MGRVSRGVLALATLASLAMLAYAVNRFRSISEPRALAWYVATLAATAFCWWASRQSPARRLAVAVMAVSSVVTLVAVEWSVEWMQRAAFVRTQKRIERLTGVPFDPRSVPEVVQALWQTDPSAMPSIVPKVMIEYAREDADTRARFDASMLPLAGVSRRTTVQLCNEDGRYPIYRSDEHGFMNPAAPWDSLSGGLLLIGDSFVHGYCVPEDSTFAANLRRRWPVTLNLGQGGSGPLSELAILSEYGLPTGPTAVLWVFFENDLLDLVHERRHPTLGRYLDPAFSQSLRLRQPEVDAAVEPWVHRVYGAGLAPRLFAEHGIRELVTLSTLRRLVADTRRVPEDPAKQLPLLREVLAAAQARVRAQGGSMVFAFLPEWERYYSPDRRPDGESRVEVLTIARSLGLPVVDLTPAFDAHPARSQLFGRGDLATGHYSSAGYALVAAAVIRALDSLAMGPRLDAARGR